MKLLSCCCTTSFLLCGCYSGRKLTTAEHFINSTFLKKCCSNASWTQSFPKLVFYAQS